MIRTHLWDLAKANFRLDYTVSDATQMRFWAGGNFGQEAIPDLLTSRRKASDTHLPTRNGFGHIQYRRAFSPDSDLRVDASYAYWKDDGGGTPFTTRRHTAELQYSRPLGTAHRLVAGGFGEKLSCRSSYLGEERPQDDLYGFYAQDEYKANGAVALTGGIRYDKHTDIEGVLSPRIAMVWKLAETQRLRLGVGSAFRKPSFLETYANQSDGPSPQTASVILGLLEVPGGTRKPEKMTSYTADYQAALGPHVVSRIDFFVNHIKDAIILKKVEPFSGSEPRSMNPLCSCTML